MFLSADYVRWLERLPCNRHARRRQQRHGEWLAPWISRSEKLWSDETSIDEGFYSFNRIER